MTTEVLIPWLTPQFFSSGGGFLVGGQLFTYAAGTNTPAQTFTDSTGLTPNTNPVIANSRGEMSVYTPPNVGFKMVLQDAAGNTIWTRDNVVNSQLISLYAGVDTGIVNALVLNFAANFAVLTDGIVLYFIPANSNTGPVTVNVNGLGVVPIINQNGTPLTANELLAGQVATIMFKGGNWLLIQGAQQGLVSWGGTDTGVANAYVVALTNQYFAYQAGNVLFFIPSHTNTTLSTINVKGLGPQSIFNVSGGALVGGELQVGQLTQLLYTGTAFQIVTPISWSGSFALAGVTGGTGGGTPTVQWTRYGNIVSLQIPAISVTSTATTFQLTGFANYLQGVTTLVYSPLFSAVDNSTLGASAYFTIPNQIGGSTVTININNASGNWTAAGVKTINQANFSYIAR